jgi:ubiquinol-cytochrome c reductase cytochrome c subunit
MTIVFALPLVLAAVLGVAPPDSGPSGALLYAAACASCHGARQSGTADGPPLRGAGLAAVDFYLTTGRMPAANAWVQVAHRDERAGQQLPLAQIRALEAYLAPVVAGGPAIPHVIAGSDHAHGRGLYEINCEQCHAAGGTGGGIGEADWAPNLRQASINEVADAIRTGPGQMPRFGERQLPQSDLDDLAGYVLSMQTTPLGSRIPLPSSGPVPEGAIGYVAIVALVSFVFGFWRLKP